MHRRGCAKHLRIHDAGHSGQLLCPLAGQAHVKMPNETSILSLPKELLSNISSWLDDRESCGMEVATKSFYTALSNPCGPPRTRLNLGSSWEADGPPTPR